METKTPPRHKAQGSKTIKLQASDKPLVQDFFAHGSTRQTKTLPLQELNGKTAHFSDLFEVLVESDESGLVSLGDYGD